MNMMYEICKQQVLINEKLLTLLKSVLLFSLLMLMPFCQLTAQHKFSALPAWLSKATFYQIYPQSFKDSNGDGIGDLKGITEKLDYVQSMGIDAIWLNPIFESPFFDAGYDVSDYYKIAPRYGTEHDLKNLLIEAHKRNIKVVLDLVAGHSSDEHPWFIASQKKAKNEYSDRYIWTNNQSIQPQNFVSGKFERNGNFLKNFYDCQPALNYGYVHPNPKNKWEQPITAKGPQKMRAELRNIIEYWMKLGVDGFRVDMASSLIKNDTDFSETMNLWAEMRIWFQQSFPQGVLIAEWSKPSLSIKAGFMIDFMMHFNVPGYPSMFFNKGGVFQRDTCYFDLDGNGSAHEFISNYTHELNNVGTNGYVSIPTSNHDINRLNSGVRNSDEQLKVALTFLLTIKGIPFIYYGDEIGMRYIPDLPSKEGSVLTNFNNANRTGTRTPMQWDNSINAGFSASNANQLYLPVDNYTFFPNVAAQEKNPASLLNFSKYLISLRKTIPALGNDAEIQFFNSVSHTYPLVYIRYKGSDTYLVVINPSGKSAEFELDKNGFSAFEPLLVQNVLCSIKNKKIIIEADKLSYGIFKLLN
jgi:maltose alpha-D-glucosyltransferase/alpha-amylase